jgi:uncharacterized membrane protein
MHWLVSYAVMLLAFFILDAGWITLVARKFYDIEVSDVMRPKPRLGAAVLFYIVYAAGVTAFATLPLTRHFDGVHATLATYRDVAIWGAGLGFFAYSTYALTNQSLIKEWKYKLVFTDLAWGAFLTALVSLIGFAAFRALT